MFAERVDRLMYLRLRRAKTTIELEGLLGVTWHYDVSSPEVSYVENLHDLPLRCASIYNRIPVELSDRSIYRKAT